MRLIEATDTIHAGRQDDAVPVDRGVFRQFVGDRAKIVMSDYVLGRRRFTGLMVDADDNSVTMEVDGESFELPYSQIESARLDPVF